MQASNLKGKRILITRAEHQLDQLSRSVRKYGAIPVRFPCLAVHVQAEEIRRAISQLADYSDVVFTSVNGVRSVLDSVENIKTLLHSKRLAAVGGKTANALHQAGLQTDIIPQTASQDGLLQTYLKQGLPDQLMFFRAREGRETLIRALQDRGVNVLLVPAYQTICPQDNAAEIITALSNNTIDAILLGSAKAARCYIQRIGDIDLARRPQVVAISDHVAQAARHAGLDVQIVAKTASFDAMLNELAKFYHHAQ